MRILVLLMALAMPLVAWFSQRGAFGPTNGAISDRYPTLIVAAGYAFAIWGVIFLLDLAFGLWQSSARRRRVSALALAQVRVPAALGFALTAAWMPVFSQQHFLLALAVIWTALAAMLLAALRLSRDPAPESGQTLWAWLPLSLHAGWLSLAAFLNTAQVIVAYRWLSTERMLPWSLVLFALAAVLLLGMNRAMRGNLAYAAAALWALAAVYVKQAASTLAGAQSAAWVALLLAAVLALQMLWLRLRARR
ncbi:hypothetical protein [Xanthomonas sacchari]|uniref:hypothetical protein n=1 Tax=Xanthomonas sacchari TaxID=56458 RepID=UPI00225E3AC5|nr:hypothetical protein [Xanthomonas sacchari]MCW0424568.1 hypothetical protein [Xanthomonas sacchari]